MLWRLPYVAWLGILALAFFGLAVLTVTTGLVDRRQRLRVHRTFALTAIAITLVHAYLALSPYFR